MYLIPCAISDQIGGLPHMLRHACGHNSVLRKRIEIPGADCFRLTKTACGTRIARLGFDVD